MQTQIDFFRAIHSASPWTDARIAKRLGVCRQSVSAWRTGRVKLPIGAAATILYLCPRLPADRWLLALTLEQVVAGDDVTLARTRAMLSDALEAAGGMPVPECDDMSEEAMHADMARRRLAAGLSADTAILPAPDGVDAGSF